MEPPTQNQLKIREIVRHDSRAVYNMIEAIYASTDMMCQPFSEKYPTVESLDREIDEYHQCSGAMFLVAELAGCLSGYVTVKPQSQLKLSHTAYLNMGVSETARGHSVGRRLLSAAISRIKSDDVIEILYLNVRADNVPAVRLYESAQFEVICVLTRDTKFDGKYYDGLLMRRFI